MQRWAMAVSSPPSTRPWSNVFWATSFDGSVQQLVDSYYKILMKADSGSPISDSAVTAQDFANVGVVKTDGSALTAGSLANTSILGLMGDAIGKFGPTSAQVNTASALQAMEKAAENIIALSALHDSGAATDTAGNLGNLTYQTAAEWLAGFAALGLTGVTATNLQDVKKAIDSAGGTTGTGEDGSSVDTVAEIQALISQVRLQAFANDTGNYYASAATNTKTAPLPTLDDWSQFGLQASTSLTDAIRVALNQAAYWKTTNPSNALIALDSALDTQTVPITKAVLQDIVDAYGRILQEADGSRATNTDVSKVSVTAGLTGTDVTITDLSKVGVDSTSLNHMKAGDLLASCIGSLPSTAVDTVYELNTLAGYTKNIMDQAAANGGAASTVTYSDNDWLTALSSLGISGASTSNIAAIKSAILGTDDSGSGVQTWDQLQGIVSLVRLNDYATSNANTVPSLGDYQAILADH
jgi:hypothetical protein